MGPYNLHYVLFSGIGALLCHYSHCFLSESETLFGIGAGPPLIGEGPLTDGGERADPGFFFGGGALVSCSTSTPINLIVFFWAEYQLY